MNKETELTDYKKALHIASVSERYLKQDVMKYPDGWYVCFLSLSNRYVKVSNVFKTKAIAETERKLLNAR